MYMATRPRKEEVKLPVCKSDCWERSQAPVWLDFLIIKNDQHRGRNPLTESCNRNDNMSEVTYAVVNKPKPHPPHENSSHHYGNDPPTTTAPLYSEVGAPEGAVILNRTANRTAGLAGLVVSAGVEQVSGTPNHYEDLSTSVTDMNDTTSVRDGLEFNYRVQKPRGPRTPPAGWT